MKALGRRFEHFLNERSRDKEERLRLLVFLVGTSLMMIFMLLHIVGSMGLRVPFLRMLSALVLVATVVLLVGFFRRRVTVIQAFTAYALAAQLAQSVRMVYLAVERPEGYAVMLLGNQIGAYTNLLYVTLGFVPRVPVYVTAMSLASLLFAGLYRGGAIHPQVVLLFVLLSVFTCMLAHISQRGIHTMQQESHSHQAMHAALLRALHMTHEELSAYLELCRSRKPGEEPRAKFFEQLGEEVRERLVQTVLSLKQEHDVRQMELARLFPSLSETELEVCRLVAAGKKLSEIACITDKSTSNVSTVRGNIRRKLGLDSTQDLRAYLTEKVEAAQGKEERKKQRKYRP